LRRAHQHSAAVLHFKNRAIHRRIAIEQYDYKAELACIPLTRKQRTGHLPKLFQDLIRRLRLNSGLPASTSLAARDHGEMRADKATPLR
jgi:hypothetical protein